MVPNWSGGKLKIALDIHRPWLNGKRNEDIYLVGNSDSTIENNQIVFSKLLEKNSIGEIKLNHSNFLPYGVGWNSAKNFTAGMSFSRWTKSLEGISLSSTLEFPYANVSEIPVSKDSARIFGKAIAYSIQEYLQLIK
jgi:hypothetical protein